MAMPCMRLVWRRATGRRQVSSILIGVTSSICYSIFNCLHLLVSVFFFRSVQGVTFGETPMVLPIRGYLDDIRRMLVGDFHIGRGCRQRGLSRSEYCNDFTRWCDSGQQLCRHAFFGPTTQEPPLEVVGVAMGMPLQDHAVVPRRHPHPGFQRCLPCPPKNG